MQAILWMLTKGILKSMYWQGLRSDLRNCLLLLKTMSSILFIYSGLPNKPSAVLSIQLAFSVTLSAFGYLSGVGLCCLPPYQKPWSSGPHYLFFPGFLFTQVTNLNTFLNGGSSISISNWISIFNQHFLEFCCKFQMFLATILSS